LLIFIIFFGQLFSKKCLSKIPLSIFKNVDNFNPIRLQKSASKAYPINDRPRGNNDISSVKYYQKPLFTKKLIKKHYKKIFHQFGSVKKRINIHYLMVRIELLQVI